jgi:hypothetical protein
LAFLDAPIVVGDPNGLTAYANRAFEQRLERPAAEAVGTPLAELFEGGAREAVLRAVLQVCEQAETVRFRLRERGIGFSAIASPILAEDESVGVVILLQEEVEGIEALLSLHREIERPLEELETTLGFLLEATGGRRNPEQRSQVEDGLRSLERLRRWSQDMGGLLAGGGSDTSPSGRVSSAALLAKLRARARRLAERASTELDVLTPARLPDLCGDEGRVEAGLLRMLETRFDRNEIPARLTLSARVVAGEAGESVLLALSEDRPGGYEAPFAEDPEVTDVLTGQGATLHGAVDASLGRTALIRLPTLG